MRISGNKPNILIKVLLGKTVGRVLAQIHQEIALRRWADVLLQCLKPLQVPFDAEPFSDLLEDLQKEQFSNTGNWRGEVFARQAPDLINKDASDEDWVECWCNFKGLIFWQKECEYTFYIYIYTHTQLLMYLIPYLFKIL